MLAAVVRDVERRDQLSAVVVVSELGSGDVERDEAHAQAADPADYLHHAHVHSDGVQRERDYESDERGDERVGPLQGAEEEDGAEAAPFGVVDQHGQLVHANQVVVNHPVGSVSCG